MTKYIKTWDYFGTEKLFIICFETLVLHETFAIGIDTTEPNEVSIFHVTNDGRKDNYTCLDTCFWDVYEKYHFSFEEKFKKEIKIILKRVLTTRIKSGMITIEQIERW